MAPVGEPSPSRKPQPIGNEPFIFLFTVCTLCFLFILWRRADSLRSVVAHGLKSMHPGDGRIRLSEDDGPPAQSFVADDDEDDMDDEPLSTRVERLRGGELQDGQATANAARLDPMIPLGR